MYNTILMTIFYSHRRTQGEPFLIVYIKPEHHIKQMIELLEFQFRCRVLAIHPRKRAP